MMCLKTWVNRTRDDYPKIQDWCAFVNNNYKFAKESSKPLDYVGKCEISDLPSFHPYWMYSYKLEKNKNKVKTKPHKIIKVSKRDLFADTQNLEGVVASLVLACICGRDEVLSLKNWITWRLEDYKPVPYGTVELEGLRHVAEDKVTSKDKVVKIFSIVTN